MNSILSPIFCFFALGNCPEPPASDPTLVRTSYGLVQGAHSSQSQSISFKGVPYAKAPIGSLRWRPPQSPENWQGTLETIDFRPTCGVGGEEDCLYLNIYTPSHHSENGEKPVLFWIHGGGFARESGNDLDGQFLASQFDVVVVSINYRLGITGFLAHPVLSQEEESVSGIYASGNYGFLDQIQALRFVNQEIQNFGGDPSNITIFGQSAGGHSVCSLIFSNQTEGLFQKAIIQSMDCPTRSLQEAESRFLAWESSVGSDCAVSEDPIACYRSLSFDYLKSVEPPYHALSQGWYPGTYMPVVETPLVMDASPKVLLETGHFNQVPVLIGTTTDEGQAFAGIPGIDPDGLDFLLQDLGLSSGQSASVLQHYLANYRDLYPGDKDYWYNALFGDLFFTCPQRQFVRLLEPALSEPVYKYNFDIAAISSTYAVHGAEVPFVFQLLESLGQLFQPPIIPNYGQLLVQTNMGQLWTSFARSGVPQSLHVPEWFEYEFTGEHDDEIYLSMEAAGPRFLSDHKSSECELMGELFY